MVKIVRVMIATDDGEEKYIEVGDVVDKLNSVEGKVTEIKCWIEDTITSKK